LLSVDDAITRLPPTNTIYKTKLLWQDAPADRSYSGAGGYKKRFSKKVFHHHFKPIEEGSLALEFVLSMCRDGYRLGAFPSSLS
jgi:hypothetical protein